MVISCTMATLIIPRNFIHGLARPALRTASRNFQTYAQQPLRCRASIEVTPLRLALGNHSAVFKSAFQQRRGYQSQATLNSPVQGNITQRLIYGGAIVGGTLLAINLVFNRETREDGGMPPYERSYLNDTFLHTGLGIGRSCLSIAWACLEMI